MSEIVAGVDLGSNSFRVLIARLQQVDSHVQIIPLEKLKETVRFAAGLDQHNYLDQAAFDRALIVLQQFGQYLHDYGIHKVKVVATNTFRVARNINEFMDKAQQALGFPIEIISGQEEARLIYMGVSCALPAVAEQRLIIDIGGGSTECIIGQGYVPILLESLSLGCVSYSQTFFKDGNISAERFLLAEQASFQTVQPIVATYKQLGWDKAFGSSGTSKALRAILHDTGFDRQAISVQGMEQLKQRLIVKGRVEDAQLLGIKADRIPVLAGGLAIMLGIFKALDIANMDTADGALRLGVVHDLSRL